MHNIGYITSEFQQLSGYKRGIAYYLDNIIEVLNNDKDIQHIVIISKSHTIKKEYNIGEKVKVIPIYIKNKSFLGKIIFIFKVGFLLPKVIEKYKLDIIETQETHTPLLMYNLIGFNKHIKHIIRLHSPEGFLASVIEKKTGLVNNLYKFILVFLEKIFLQKCNKLGYMFSSPSSALLNEVKQFYKINLDQNIIIPNFIINLTSNKNLVKDYSKKRFLYIGGLQVRKNTLSLLIEIEKILKKYNNCEFILVGKIGENIIKTKIQQLMKLKGFIYKGEIYGKEKYNLLEYSTYYIIHSWENYSMSMIEASLYKNYLISIDLGGNKEINKFNTMYKEGELYKNLANSIENTQNIKEKIEQQLLEVIKLNTEGVNKSIKLIKGIKQ